jgi:hypothetical protein
MSDSNLLPCPHCGEVEELYPSYRWKAFSGGEWQLQDKPYAIDCIGCGYDFVPREGRDVIAMWNRRAAPDLHAALEANISTMQETRRRLREYRKPTNELSAAIEETQAALAKARGE